MWMSISSLCLTILDAGLLVHCLQLAFTRKTSLPPGPKPLPLIGNIHQLPKSLQWLHLYHLSKQYGAIMHISMAGQPLIILSTHASAHEILSCRSARYSDRPRMVMSGEMVTRGMHMLLRRYDERYILHQRMEAPLLSLKSASTYRPLQDLESRQLLLDVVNEYDEHGEKGVDFHHHFERAMASTIYCLNYGYRLKTGYEQALVHAKKVQAEFARTGQVGAYLVDSLPSLNYLPRCMAPWKKEADELFELECNLHEGNLDKGLRSNAWNFSKYMKVSPQGKTMPKTELAFDLGILSDAALDTSTVALDWFIVAWITTGGTGWVRKAQELIGEVVGKERMPTFEDRPRLPFVDAIVSETLRWRPVIPGGVPHFTKEEDIYLDYRIPANSIVIGNAFAITRDESVFGDNVNTFDPERWISHGNVSSPVIDACGLNTSALKDLPQTGFGFGRRVCTGRTIARTQLFIQVARMLWAFDVEAAVVDEKMGRRHLVDDMDCTDGFVTRPKPFRAAMRPRGEWVKEVVRGMGSTHEIDHSTLLEQVRKDRN